MEKQIGQNSETLLECGGCWDGVTILFSRTFKDGWDTGEKITGEFCSGCCELVDGGHSLPNMRGAYRRP